MMRKTKTFSFTKPRGGTFSDLLPEWEPNFPANVFKLQQVAGRTASHLIHLTPKRAPGKWGGKAVILFRFTIPVKPIRDSSFLFSVKYCWLAPMTLESDSHPPTTNRHRPTPPEALADDHHRAEPGQPRQQNVDFYGNGGIFAAK